MKRYFLLILITATLLGLLIQCSRKAGDYVRSFEDIPFEDPFLYKPHLKESFHPELQAISRRSEYHLKLVIDEELDTVQGEARMKIVNTSGDSVSTVPFYLLPNLHGNHMTVESVSIHGSNLTFSLDDNGSLLRTDLPEPVNPGEKVHIDIAYTLQVPGGAGIGYGALQSLQDTVSLAYAYPVVPTFLEEYTTDPVRHGDLTDTEAAFFIVEIEAPKDLQLVSSGSPGSTKAWPSFLPGIISGSDTVRTRQTR